MRYTDISLGTYGEYSTENYGGHCILLQIGDITLWFSYKTVVAFQAAGRIRVVRKNEWGPTTGKHLRWIDDGEKEKRVPGEEFQRQLDYLLDHYHLIGLEADETIIKVKRKPYPEKPDITAAVILGMQ